MTRALLATVALAVAAPALGAPTQSPRWGTFQLSFSGYRPRVDAEFGGAATPFQSTLGGGRNVMFRADIAYTLFDRFGSVDVGIGGGYWEKNGHALQSDLVTPSSDETALKIIPSRVFVTYRFDLLAERWSIPLAPYARVSFDRYWWWTTNGSGGTSTVGGHGGRGATNGYSFSAGMALLLDVIDPTLAREMDRDIGINHTYLFVDFTKSYVKDFGSATSWDLSDDQVTIAGGLMFVF